MSKKLTEHFSYAEMTVSGWASSRGVENTPSQEQYNNLLVAAMGMEEVRSILHNNPIRINSGFRNPKVNAGVGGSKTSDHMTGFAVDFVCPKFGTPLEICKAIAASGLKYDQLIQEGNWVHISFSPKMRQQNLTKNGSGFKQGISHAN